MKVTVLAPAKINLSLDILGKRPDGYHLVKMLMQSVDLCDIVTVWETGDGEISLSCNAEGVPCDKTNTALRAVEAFFASTQKKNPGFGIKIKKRIPGSAGLAGGSTDAAAVLVALNELMNTRLSKEELCDIGEEVGADVPFCIVGATMVATGIGTILTPAPDMPECSILMAKPPVSVSTREAYALADDRECYWEPHTDDAVEAVCDGELQKIADSLYNDFEELVHLKEVDDIKELMLENGALGACMSGSGPTVFGLFEEESAAEDCAGLLEKNCEMVTVCRPLDHGCRIND